MVYSVQDVSCSVEFVSPQIPASSASRCMSITPILAVAISWTTMHRQQQVQIQARLAPKQTQIPRDLGPAVVLILTVSGLSLAIVGLTSTMGLILKATKVLLETMASTLIPTLKVGLVPTPATTLKAFLRQ
jgi:hypothetical protein